MAVLSFQQNAWDGTGVVDCQHDDGAGVMDDVAAGANSVGLLDIVGGDRENRAAIDGAGGDDAFFLAVCGWAV